MAEFVEGIFLAPEGGAQMKGVEAATALEGCGLFAPGVGCAQLSDSLRTGWHHDYGGLSWA